MYSAGQKGHHHHQQQQQQPPRKTLSDRLASMSALATSNLKVSVVLISHLLEAVN
jgi:hypothetical protein